MANINWDKIQTIDETPITKTTNSIDWNKVKTYETDIDRLKSYGQDIKQAFSKPIQITDVKPTRSDVRASKNIQIMGRNLGNINLLTEEAAAKRKIEREEQAKQQVKDIMGKTTLMGKIGGTAIGGAVKVAKGVAKAGENITDALAIASQLQPRANIGAFGVNTSIPVSKQMYEETTGKKYEPEKSLLTKFAKKDLTTAFDTASKYLDDTSAIKSDSFSGKILENIGSMIPTILGGGYASTAITAFGSAGEQALKEGASLQEATLYGIGNSAIEIGTEALTGGIPGLKGSFSLDSLVAKKLLKQEGLEAVSKSMSKAIIKAGYKMIGEGGEEALSSVIQPLLRKAVYKQGETIDWEQVKKDVIESALIGGIVGGILNLPGTITDVQQSKQNIPTQPIQPTQPVQPAQEQQTNVPIQEQTQPIEQPIQETTRETTQPQQDAKQRGVIQSIIETQNIPVEIKNNLKNNDRANYMVVTDADALQVASESLASKGTNKAYNQFKDRVNRYESLSKYDIAEATLIANDLYAKGDVNKYQDIITDLAVNATRTGQANQALSILYRTTPDGRVLALQKQINQINNDNKNKKGWENIELDTQDITNIKNAKNKQDLENAVDKAIKNVGNKLPKTFGNYVDEIRYTFMLGNPKTHIRNIVSNIAMKGVSKVKDTISTSIETLVRPDVRTKTFRKVNKKTKDFVKQDTLDQRKRIQGIDKYDTGKNILKAKESKVSELNSKLLEFEDWFFSSKSYKNAMEQYITANNYNVDTMTPQQLETARDYAVKKAQEETFRDFSEVANWLTKLQKKNTFTKIAVGGVLPFKTTPINIAKRAIEYNPVSLAKTLTTDLKKLKSGEITSAKYIDNISKGITGTGILGLGYLLSKMGVLTASGSDEDKEKYLNEDYGRQAYSLNIGGKSYSLNWLSPAAIPLFIGAEMNEMKDDKKIDSGNLTRMADAFSTMLNPLTEMSMLQGLESTLSSYEKNALSGIVINTAQNYAGQFIPTILGQVARTIDTKRRDTTGKGKGLDKTLSTFINRQKAKIPGLSQTLEPFITSFGEEQKTGTLAERAIQNFLSPAYIKDIKSDKVEKELLSLYKQTGEKTLLPDKPERYFTQKGEKIYLTPKEYTQWAKTDGQYVAKELSRLFNTSYYKDWSDERKIAAIEKAYRSGQAIAKRNYLQNK